MSLNVKNPEACELATRLAALTGETKTKAVVEALRERLEREQRKRGREGIATKLMEIGRRVSADLNDDQRSPDEILGYDEWGLPT